MELKQKERDKTKRESNWIIKEGEGEETIKKKKDSFDESEIFELRLLFAIES